MSAGSASALNVTSRLAPIPSKADPVSSAAATVTNRMSPRRYAKSIRSPPNASGAGMPPRGTRLVATATAARPTAGPARNTHVVVRLYVAPLRRHLAMS